MTSFDGVESISAPFDGVDPIHLSALVCAPWEEERIFLRRLLLELGITVNCAMPHADLGELYLRSMAHVALLLDSNRSVGVTASELAAQLVRRVPHARVVVVGPHGDHHAAVAAMLSGAVTYIDRSILAASSLRAALTAAAALPQLRTPSFGPRAGAPQLTWHEHRTLIRVAQGKTNVEIAEELHIGERAVAYRVHQLCSKFGVEGRIGLIRAAFRYRYVQ